MLLHRDADFFFQRNPENKEGTCKVETHVVSLNVNKQVLLMTCKMNVT